MIPARFDGRCSCGEPISEGDPIGLVDGEWCCEACVDEMGEDE
jgi:hypothetical protein